jgi:NAD(P)-dependent dehydrogenase (short-subunit alcohol dehydrogenase family)
MTALRGRHALVTGANRGIGAAIARHLAQAGADVTLLVRTPASAEPLATALGALGVRARVVGADVTDATALAAACAAAEAIAPVDILVNNAGSAETAPFLRSDEALFTRMLDVHLLAPVRATHAVLPGMLARGWGRIVNVASIAGLGGAPYITAYAAAKHAEVGFTRALAAECLPKGVLVNAVCPGYTDTDMVHGAVAKLSAKTGHPTEAALGAILAEAGQRRLVTTAEVADAVLAFCLPTTSASGETRALMGEGPAA